MITFIVELAINMVYIEYGIQCAMYFVSVACYLTADYVYIVETKWSCVSVLTTINL